MRGPLRRPSYRDRSIHGSIHGWRPAWHGHRTRGAAWHGHLARAILRHGLESLRQVIIAVRGRKKPVAWPDASSLTETGPRDNRRRRRPAKAWPTAARHRSARAGALAAKAGDVGWEPRARLCLSTRMPVRQSPRRALVAGSEDSSSLPCPAGIRSRERRDGRPAGSRPGSRLAPVSPLGDQAVGGNAGVERVGPGAVHVRDVRPGPRLRGGRG